VDKRLKLWEEIIKSEGYTLDHRKYEFWDNVPTAVKEGEEIPLAVYYVDKQQNDCIVTAKDIVANKANFYTLRRYHRQNKEYYIPDFEIEIKWKGKTCTLIPVFLY